MVGDCPKRNPRLSGYLPSRDPAKSKVGKKFARRRSLFGVSSGEKTKVPQGGLEPPTRGFIGRGGLLSAIGQSWAIVVEA